MTIKHTVFQMCICAVFPFRIILWYHTRSHQSRSGIQGRALMCSSEEPLIDAIALAFSSGDLIRQDSYFYFINAHDPTSTTCSRPAEFNGTLEAMQMHGSKTWSVFGRATVSELYLNEIWFDVPAAMDALDCSVHALNQRNRMTKKTCRGQFIE